MAQLGARLDGIEEVVGSNPIGSTKLYNVRLQILAFLFFPSNDFGNCIHYPGLILGCPFEHSISRGEKGGEIGSD